MSTAYHGPLRRHGFERLTENYLVHLVNLPLASRHGAFFTATTCLAGGHLVNLPLASLHGAALVVTGAAISDVAAIRANTILRMLESSRASMTPCEAIPVSAAVNL